MSPAEPPPTGRGTRLRWLLAQRLGAPHDLPVHEPDPDEGTGTDQAMKVAATFAGRFLVIVAFLYVLIWLLNQISLVTITLTVAVMLSAILRPLVNALVRAGLPRALAAPVVFLLGIAVIGVALWFVITQITGSMDMITAQLNRASIAILDWLQTGPAHMSIEQVNRLSTEVTSRLVNVNGDVVSGTLGAASSLVGYLTGSILCLFALLFLLLDDGRIWSWVVGLFPARDHARVRTGGEVAWRTLVAYMRSTIVLALINALTMVPIMMFARMDLIVPLAVLLFLGSLIPMVGMLAAGAVLVLVALVMQGPVTALVIGVALFLVIQLEGNLLNPYILGKAVRIHPLAILATVTGGTLVGGVFGAFVAVPFVAIVNNVLTAVRRSTGEETDEGPMLAAGDVVDDAAADGGPAPDPAASRVVPAEAPAGADGAVPTTAAPRGVDAVERH